MKGNIGQLMKQAQQMQENMRRMQEQLAALEVEGQSGAGMVKVQMTCKYEVKRVTIDPSLVGDDREMLEEVAWDPSELARTYVCGPTGFVDC